MSSKPKITAKSQSFVLTRFALGKHETILLTKEQYDQIALSRETISEITVFEEKFFAICELFREIEKFTFETSLRNMVYLAPSTNDFYLARAIFGSKLASLLSAVRLYNESIFFHAEMISNGVLTKEDIKAVSSTRYDNSFPYRMMEALRNYSQHSSLPVHSSRFGGSWDNEMKWLTFSTDFYLDVDELIGDKKFKSEIKNEFEAAGGKFDLKNGARSYFSSVCEMHTEFRSRFNPFLVKSDSVMKHWQDEWLKVDKDNSLVGVVACALIGELIDKKLEKVFIKTHTDEYRDTLEKRTGAIVNMAKRNVAF
jgi:hypothetical protein